MTVHDIQEPIHPPKVRAEGHAADASPVVPLMVLKGKTYYQEVGRLAKVLALALCRGELTNPPAQGRYPPWP